MSAEHRIKELRQKLNYFNHKYYVEAAPVVSDYEFDTMLRELQDLEALHPEMADPNSPTMRVGSDITNKFRSIAHAYPMLSLSNTYSLEELHEWIGKVRAEVGDEVEFCCELKFDGSAISLTYEGDSLHHAVTRGDGTRGDEVTENIRTIGHVPLVLQQPSNLPSFEVRGEVYMSYPTFDRLNAEREATGEQLFANPRNAAAGTLKLQQSQVVAKRELQFVPYQVEGQQLPFTSHSESMESLRAWGFPVSEAMRKCRSEQEIDNYIEYWDKQRHEFPTPIDGVVIKVNSYADRRKMGRTSKAPKWAVAYKFKAEQALTKLLEVSYQVGRTGAITPVANLDAVHLAGTTVKRATLHNADQIAALDLRVGDMVYVEKGGEIIPKVTGVELSCRAEDSQPLQYITHCPECGTELVRYEGEAKHYCPNQSHCRPQIVGRIIHFVGRKAMNIQSLGEKIIEHLFDIGYIKNIDDLYKLDKDTIANTKTITALTSKEAEKLYNNIHCGKKTNHQVVKKLITEGEDIYSVSIERLMSIKFEKNIGEKTAEKIIDNIKDSTLVPFNRVLFALGIRFVGETTAKYLAAHFKSLDAIMQASKEELIEAEEVGDKIADSILDYFNDSDNLNIINNLKFVGLKFNEETNTETSDSLIGLKFVVSGVFKSFERDEIKALIETNGGKNISSVSANTSYLLAGENAGPSKLAKANQLGINIISEKQFLEMIGYESTINSGTPNNITKNNLPEITYYNNDTSDFNFIAFDCEWANNNRDICEIGIAIVKDCKIIQSKHWLINPQTDDYSSLQHNLITTEMLNDAPYIQDIWSEIRSIFENNVVVCHGTYADINCLYRMMQKYNLDTFDFTYICSEKFAKKNINSDKSGLAYLCTLFNIEQKEHHRAEDDARCCAKILIECYKSQDKYRSFNDIIHSFGKNFKEYIPNKQVLKVQGTLYSETPIEYNNRVTLSNKIDLSKISTLDNYCKGLNICLIGGFNIPKYEVCHMIQYLGGVYEDSVTKIRTNILVYGLSVCTTDITRYKEYEKAKKYGIECISEDEFIERIKNYKTIPIQGSLF